MLYILWLILEIRLRKIKGLAHLDYILKKWEKNSIKRFAG